MTGMQHESFDDRITYRTESVRDTISQYSKRTRTPKLASGESVFSNRRNMITGRSDPNTIDLKDRERRPRQLNDLIEGKYSKRMSI